MPATVSSTYGVICVTKLLAEMNNFDKVIFLDETAVNFIDNVINKYNNECFHIGNIIKSVNFRT